MVPFLDLPLFNLIFSVSQNVIFIHPLFYFLGSLMAWILGAWFLFKVLYIKNFKKKAYILLLSALSIIISRGIITETLRFFVNSPRPFSALGFDPLIAPPLTNSMPSGHMAAFVPLAVVMFMMNKRSGIIFSVAVLVMGFARILLGVHWPTDILAGIAVGLIGFKIAQMILPKPSY